MKKMKRVKIIREVLEAKIAKNARRIQSLSEQSFEYRKLLEAANRIESQKPYTAPKEGMVDVVSENATPDPLAVEPGITPSTTTEIQGA